MIDRLSSLVCRCSGHHATCLLSPTQAPKPKFPLVR